jgi:predicted DNA binding CopG/RHH family protein
VPQEYDFSKLKEVKDPYASKKKAVGINLSREVVDYFKELATETGLAYHKLIDSISWTARSGGGSFH